MTSSPIYLDYCATTPCDPRVVDCMLPYFSHHFGNAASRDHPFGWQAEEAVEWAREQVAALIGASPEEIIFTSGATESVNLALKGLVEAAGERAPKHIITCRTEHTAVLDTCAYLETRACLETQGVRITYLEVDGSGQLSLRDLEDAIGPETICIALMYANNETGVIHPAAEIAGIAEKYGMPFLCDATQAAGKVPVDVHAAGIDLMPFSAHKMYGPKGVGALYVRKPGLKILKQQHGGAHEKGRRSGTLNVPGIIGFGEAAGICLREMPAEMNRLQQLRDKMENRLLERLPGSRINGKDPVNGGLNRLPQVSNILFPSTDGEQLVLAVSGHLAVSRGSACSGIVERPSHVLTAMGLTPEAARNSIRISLGRFTEETEIDRTTDILSESVRKLQTAIH